MLEIRDLTTGYPGKPVLEHFSASIPEGSVTAILGPNGCGKSTLLKAISGLLPIKKGQILWDSQDLGKLSSSERARTVACLPQNRRIPDITVQQLVLHGRFPYVSYPRRYRSLDLEITQQAMETLHIAHLAEKPLASLSGGQQQRVYIAMALAQDTPLVLLDEPTTYLDVHHQLQILSLARLLRHRGKTVVMVLHDLNQALQNADRILLLDQGRLMAQGTPEEVFASGMLDPVFGVSVCRVSFESGWQYYWK